MDDHAAPFAAAADAFLAQESARLPDLSPCTVLVPHFAAASGLAAALRGRIGATVHLPPRMLTLDALAAAQPLDMEIDPDSLRLAEIHDFLERSGLLREQALWPAARELLQVLAEISAARLAPPDSPEDFMRQVAGGYRARLSLPLELEARLVFELWHAMQQGRRRDAMAGHAQRLAQAADRAAGPLYCFGLTRLAPLEEAFLARWQARHPVHTLPCPPAYPARQAMLAAAWPEDTGAGALLQRARDIATRHHASPLAGAVRICAADSLEAEASAAAGQLCEWLARGRRRIAIVAFDRMAARRLRALLERRGILVQDETGWTFSTTSVAHVLDRLFALLQDNCYYRDLLDLLKSPFVFAGVDDASREAMTAELEQAIRRAGTVEGWSRFRQLARQAAPQAMPLLDRLETARGRFPSGAHPLSAWQTQLLSALDDLGSRERLAADPAGAQMLQLLARLAEETAGHRRRYPRQAWLAWLGLQLESAAFRDDRIESPVCLVPPLAARLRPLDAAILLGADADHLPSPLARGLFNDRVRTELGLPGIASQQAEARATLADLLGGIPEVLITWQAHLGSDPNPLSPWLELLDGLHRLAYGSTLKIAAPPCPPGTATAAAAPAQAPAPVAERLPQTLSASAWQSLVDCPYRYFARHVLGLGELDEVPEEMEKRDYGERVHAILHAFHTRHPLLAGEERQSLRDDLERIGLAEFEPHLAQNYLATGWLSRWQGRLDDYLDWALAHEAAGYRWTAGEADFERPVEFAPGRQIVLRGRADRIDRGPGGALLLDYKAKSRQSLRGRMKQPGEDVQLPFYGLLSGAPEAAYVVLDDARVELLPQADLAGAAEAEAARIGDTLARIAERAPLPAQGAQAICAHCEMRGLCRRDYWR